MGFRIDRNRYAIVNQMDADSRKEEGQARRDARQNQSQDAKQDSPEGFKEVLQGAALEALKKEVEKILLKFQSNGLVFSLAQEGAELIVQALDPSGKLVRKIRAQDFLKMQSSSAKLIDQKV